MFLQGANVDSLALQGLRFGLRIAFACERGLAVASKPPIRETSPPILRAALQLASPWQSFACANDPAGYLANCVFDVLLAVAVFVAKFPGVPLTDYDYFY